LTTGISKLYDKRYQFLIFTLLIFVFVVSKVSVSTCDKGNIKFTISQNRVNIKQIYQRRDIKYKKSYYTNKIDLTANSRELTNANGKKYGFYRNFFIDFKTKIILDRDTKIRFIIYSDDGFSLKIDGKVILKFEKTRPIAKNEKEIFLKKGLHRVSLSYFQGVGLLGVKALYRVRKKRYFIGVNSDNVKFVK